MIDGRSLKRLMMIDKYQVPRFHLWYCACWVVASWSCGFHHDFVLIFFLCTPQDFCENFRALEPWFVTLNPAIYLLLINCCTKSCVCLSDRQYSNYWSTPPFYSSHNKLCYFQFIIFKTTQPTQCNMTYNSLLLSSMIAYVCFLKIPPSFSQRSAHNLNYSHTEQGEYVVY